MGFFKKETVTTFRCHACGQDLVPGDMVYWLGVVTWDEHIKNKGDSGYLFAHFPQCPAGEDK